LKVKCVLIFSKLLSETFLILRRILLKMSNVRLVKYRYSFQILTKIEFSGQNF
jgi:hypothetical protein